jgi:hypothetical protein
MVCVGLPLSSRRTVGRSGRSRCTCTRSIATAPPLRLLRRTASRGGRKRRPRTRAGWCASSVVFDRASQGRPIQLAAASAAHFDSGGAAGGWAAHAGWGLLDCQDGPPGPARTAAEFPLTTNVAARGNCSTLVPEARGGRSRTRGPSWVLSDRSYPPRPGAAGRVLASLGPGRAARHGPSAFSHREPRRAPDGGPRRTRSWLSSPAMKARVFDSRCPGGERARGRARAPQARSSHLRPSLRVRRAAGCCQPAVASRRRERGGARARALFRPAGPQASPSRISAREMGRALLDQRSGARRPRDLVGI